MKLLFVHEKFGAFGGAEANIEITAEELLKAGHELSIAYLSNTNRDSARWDALFSEKWDLCSTGVEVGAVIQESRPDAIYVHSIADLKALEQITSSGIPAVRMVHDHDLCCPRRHKYTVWTGHVCRRGAGWRCWADLAFLARSQHSPWKPAWVDIGSKLEEVWKKK